MILGLKLDIVSKLLPRESRGFRNKPWFDQECSELANKRKQAKLLCLQNPNDQTAEDFSNVTSDTSRTFKKKKCDYMKKLEENSKNKNIQEMYKGINEFKKVINLVLIWYNCIRYNFFIK